MEKQRWEESEKRREEKKKEDQRRERVRRKKMQVREKVKKSRETPCVFQLICGTRGSKSRLAKAARAEASRQMRDEKLHAAVARSTFRSENVQNRPTAEHFLKVVMWKSARRCGAKRMWKEKV